jgi:hypothetical protein
VALPLATGNLENQATLQLEIFWQSLQLIVWLYALHGKPASSNIT